MHRCAPARPGRGADRIADRVQHARGPPLGPRLRLVAGAAGLGDGHGRAYRVPPAPDAAGRHVRGSLVSAAQLGPGAGQCRVPPAAPRPARRLCNRLAGAGGPDHARLPVGGGSATTTTSGHPLTIKRSGAAGLHDQTAGRGAGQPRAGQAAAAPPLRRVRLCRRRPVQVQRARVPLRPGRPGRGGELRLQAQHGRPGLRALQAVPLRSAVGPGQCPRRQRICEFG